MNAPNIGILLPTRGLLTQEKPPRDLDTLLSMAEAVEADGYDGVWVGDSLLSSPRPEPIVTLAAVAARTERVKLGTAILIGALRPPLLLAHALATVDLLSKGRLVLGVGFGGARPLHLLEHASVGVPHQERFARTIEGIEVMRALWTQEEVTHRGRCFTLDKVSLLPKPAQPGGPRFWLHGVGSERNLRRVARVGDGWITNLPRREEFTATWEKIRAYAAEAGRDGRVLTANQYCTLCLDDDAALARRRGLAFLQSYYRIDPLVLEQQIFCRFGPPEACVEALVERLEAGCGTLIIRFAGENQRQQLDVCTAKVLPLLKAARVPS